MVIPEESIAGWVAINKQPQIINNVQQDERHFDSVDTQLQFHSRSMIAIPLVARSKLIGVLEVLNKKSGPFDSQDEEILQALASQAAVAIQNSRLFAQSDMIAEFVHELRTPLSSIFTASFLLKRPEIKPEQREKLSATIHQETQRLNELASIFLDLASLESGRAPMHFALLDPLSLMEECVEIAAIKGTERGIQVEIDAPSNLTDIEADHDKLKQALINFLNNAVKYNRAQGHVWLRSRADEDSITFQIQDTGVGIPEDQISQLFTRFFRARNVEKTTPGTGLGLSISRRIVEMHGGTVEVSSTLDVGTTFTITMPIVQEGE
jgi:signal transduction histidine kinase